MWPWRRDPAAPPKVGDVLARKYRVEQILGVGGMGVVVAARHVKLGELVALKVLRPHVLRSRDDVARFFREGRAASRLKSDHVVRILDLGELTNGVPYLVMEHLEGRDLAAILRDHGPLSVEHAIDSVLEACEAVAEAHALGIVHRDLKPANLFLARASGGKARVKVLDFGISKLTNPDDSEPDLALTATRTLMGSPVYMAPEVMRSARAADVRSDVWAFGIILYELLTGVTPFKGETVTELCARVLEETPRAISRFRDDVPPGLEAVIARCLAKKPDDRWPTVLDLATALAPFAGPKGEEKLDALERVVQAARSRAQAGAPGNTSQPSVPSFEADGGDTTLRGWGTTRGSAPSRNRTVLFASAAVLVAAGASSAIFVATRPDRAKDASPSTPAFASPQGTASDDPAAKSSTTAATPSIATAPPPPSSASTKPSSGPPKKNAKPSAPPVQPKKQGPYLADDPN